MKSAVFAPSAKFFVRLFVLAAVCVTAACSDTRAEDTTSNANQLAIGVFAECALPAPLQPLLKKLYATMEGRGIEISAEVILLYDHDLTSGDNTLEVLFGGAVASELAGALGIGEDQLNGWLSKYGGEGGLLGDATVGLDFNGNWEGITFALVGYEGGDVFAGSGGLWQVLWTNDKTANAGDNSGFWAAINVTTNGACTAGGLITASNNDANVLWEAWQWLTGAAGSSATPNNPDSGPSQVDAGADQADAGPDQADSGADAASADSDGGSASDLDMPVCGMQPSGNADCDTCEETSCCTEAQTCADDSDCTTLQQCQQSCGADSDCMTTCTTNAPAQASMELSDLNICLGVCPCQ